MIPAAIVTRGIFHESSVPFCIVLTEMGEAVHVLTGASRDGQLTLLSKQFVNTCRGFTMLFLMKCAAAELHL